MTRIVVLGTTSNCELKHVRVIPIWHIAGRIMRFDQ